MKAIKEFFFVIRYLFERVIFFVLAWAGWCGAVGLWCSPFDGIPVWFFILVWFFRSLILTVYPALTNWYDWGIILFAMGAISVGSFAALHLVAYFLLPG